MLSAILAEKDADSAENVIQVGIVETETHEEERVRDEITLERHREKMAPRLVRFVIVLSNDSLVGLGDVAMHFVNHGVASWHGRRQILHCCLNVGDLSMRCKGILD